ncbi:MAG: DUF4369 domain-containing protein [Bacteroidales bacterium]|nr:DUF4369 domain-containing protein [Candidatus Physcousia equi]
MQRLKLNLSTLMATMLLLLFAACHSDKNTFHIQGHIKGAKDSLLCLEALDLSRGIQLIDSVRLGEDGSFHFAASDTIASPEFYRLRIHGQVINLSIDSTETISIEAEWPNMAFGYTVEGSGNCDTIRLLSRRLANLERRVVAMADDRRFTIEERQQNIERMVQAYKDSTKVLFIQNRYDQASSYYALFQMVGQLSIFDVENDASDVTWANAVANAWAERWPNSLRTQNLTNIALRGRKNTRRRVIKLNIDGEKVRETGIIDMGFPDIKGNERRLSDFKGEVLLLDVTAYAAQQSQERNIFLREIYNKYHARGLQIYQVSVDPDEHYWKTVSQSLPWVCVFCAEGIDNDMLRIYQVQRLDTYFLIDRNNNLVNRDENIPDLEKAIEALL